MDTVTSQSTQNQDNSQNTPMDCVGGNEIITIAVGQCGIYMLNAFLSTIRAEHKIDRNGNFTGNWNHTNDKLLMLKNNVYFDTDKRHNRYVPRSVFMDIDKTHIDNLRSSYLGSLISDDNFLSGSYAEPSVLWSTGHYIEGAECIDEYLDRVRQMFEVCDSPQGFQMFHAMAGGWGGGFGTLLLLKIRDNYPDRCTNNFSVYPSSNNFADYPSHSHNFAVYNTVLSVHQILENSDMCYTFDNGKLFHFAQKHCKLKNPTYSDLNFLISQIVSGATATLRFHCEPTVNVTLQSYNVCFCPFPRLHFVSLSHSPYFSNTARTQLTNVNAIIDGLLGPNDVSNVKYEDGKHLNMAICYRGSDETAIDKMDEYISTIQQRMAEDFVTWIPGINVQSSFIYDGDNFAYKEYTPLVSTAIVSTTAIKAVFQRMSAQFAKIYKRKGYLHWYKGDGMDEMEFQEADKNCRDLVTEYQDKQDAVVDLDWDEEDEDEDEDDYSEEDY